MKKFILYLSLLLIVFSMSGCETMDEKEMKAEQLKQESQAALEAYMKTQATTNTETTEQAPQKEAELQQSSTSTETDSTTASKETTATNTTKSQSTEAQNKQPTQNKNPETTKTTQAPPKSEYNTTPPAGVKYIGNSNTGKFHKSSCSSVRDMNPEHIVELNSREDAISAGYQPCKKCNP